MVRITSNFGFEICNSIDIQIQLTVFWDRMKFTTLIAITFLILLSACNLPEQPALTTAESTFFIELKTECKCEVERSYSVEYLRHKHEGIYTILFRSGDTLKNGYIRNNAERIVNYISTEVLRDTLIKKIELQIVEQLTENSDNRQYFEFERIPKKQFD